MSILWAAGRAYAHRVTTALVLILATFVRGDTEGCPPGAQPVCCECDSSAGPLRTQGACERIRQWLAGALPGIGYCLIGHSSVGDTYSRPVHTLCVRTVSGPADTVVVTILRPADSAVGPRVASSKRLTELSYHGEDHTAFEAVLARKIVENLRESYVCHLAVDAQPDSVTVKTDSGLEGIAPVEWIVPLGTVTLTASKPRYLPETYALELDQPGYHRWHVQLRRRRFYHSRLMVPTAVFALASGVCYTLDRYYYAEYRSLGESDYYRNPAAFEETYRRALAWERASQISLILAGLCLALSLRF